jgi:hypothetical protein
MEQTIAPRNYTSLQLLLRRAAYTKRFFSSVFSVREHNGHDAPYGCAAPHKSAHTDLVRSAYLNKR